VAAGYSYSAPGGYFIAPGHNHQAIIGAIPGAVEQIFINLEKDGAMPALTPEWTGAINGQLDLWGITTVLLGPSDHHDLQLQLLTQIMGGPPTLVDGVSVWTR